MKVLDQKTVVIKDFDELKTVLEEDNNYNYIYFGNDISITSTILINENKSTITLDGTYLDTRHTYTEINTNEQETITASDTNKNIIIKNMDIVSSQPYGVIYVPLDTIYKITIEYNNIKYNGVQMIYNPYGKTKIIDCNITIEDTNNITCQEFCESNNIEIGGTTTILNNSIDNALFNFVSNSMEPSMTFLENSRVTMTSTNRELIRGTYNLDFEILHDAVVNPMISKNSFELENAIVYKDFDDTITILNETPLLVHTGNNTGGVPEKIGITWFNEKGILLSLENNALEVNEEYNAKVVWSVEE